MSFKGAYRTCILQKDFGKDQASLHDLKLDS